jgi:hypothetical protein
MLTDKKPTSSQAVNIVCIQSCHNPKALTFCLPFEQIQGGKPMRIPFKAEGVLPLVEVAQPVFDFGQVGGCR